MCGAAKEVGHRVVGEAAIGASGVIRHLYVVVDQSAKLRLRGGRPVQW